MSKRKQYVSKEYVDSDDDDSINEKDTAKKPKLSNTSGEMLVNDQGERYFELGKKKRLTVRKWKHLAMVDIREFWEDSKDGEWKPSKKGVSLQLEQWEMIKSLIPKIDEVLSEL
ncbi:uncharacterized protein VTP21DRAFT_2227 [Calcarisporiella thermophila]|uniref:uncharacterized protein n=1 Tax=Calcarisporiella thermophila TaxID=911321 RepID=UPI003743FF8F